MVRIMLRRCGAVLLVASLVLGNRPGPSAECGSAWPTSGAVLLPAGAPLLGACGQPMISAPCPTGPCAALPQGLAGFTESPRTPVAIEYAGSFHSHTPPPPEPPPPQA